MKLVVGVMGSAEGPFSKGAEAKLVQLGRAIAEPIPDDTARVVGAPTTVGVEHITASFQCIADQVGLITRLVEEEQPREEVLMQLGSVIAATRRVGLLILEDCVDTNLADSIGRHGTTAQLRLFIACLTGRSQRS